MSTLLPFHKSIIEEIHDPDTSDLLVLARGLGLRRIVCMLMKIYDAPTNLVLLVNATPEEESAIGEELGIMGCRKPGLRVIGYETPSRDRQDLYKRGGLISVTSRILVVDMLQSDIPVHLITGLLVLHAERVTPLALEAFIVRLFREKNRKGFVKAFTDQPEHITSGMSPLKNIMKELQLRRVHLYPRFHEYINQSLERHLADVIELAQPLTESMSEIHHAIIQCMTTTLSELKRSNTNLDLDDLNVENAYFRSFDIIVRRQLDPVWHKVGPKTKQLVTDLSNLRRLLFYLLTYDALAFHAYLETIIVSNTISVSGGPKQHQSPWLLTDAANVIFEVAKRRCFVISSSTQKQLQSPPVVEPNEDDEEAWAVLDEVEGYAPSRRDNGNGKTNEDGRPSWLPQGLDPTLEELPKWDLISEILLEIEQETVRHSTLRNKEILGTDTVLIMTSSTRTCELLQEFLNMIDPDAKSGQKGRRMMMRKLRAYLAWRGKLSAAQNASNSETKASSSSSTSVNKGREPEISEALKRKDKERTERAVSRRRTRGGAPAGGDDGRKITSGNGKELKRIDARNIDGMELLVSQVEQDDHDAALTLSLLDTEGFELLNNEFEMHYGLLPAEQTVIIRAYSDDTDDRMLAEISPKFIIMFEPCVEFIRRIEVYRGSHPGLAVRVYHMVYKDSCEEHKYLAAIRKEKEAFERLVKERGSMLLTLEERPGPGSGGDSLIKTISTRLAGGRRELNKEPSRVIVDMREFRSTLPSLLHAANMLVVPATLTVGDYVLTPDICVERKSLADLRASFNSGRLYSQCELMSVHYKYPILLIEFEEDKAFSLETISDIKSYVKPTGKYPQQRNAKCNSFNATEPDAAPSIQSKLVLLTLSFPRLRIIWSSSPFTTADIFTDLKSNNPEPDALKAVSIGAEGDPDVGKGVNAAAEELIRCLPGVTSGNVGYLMSRVKSVKELCTLDLKACQELLGAGPGKSCYEFIHKGE